MRKVEVAAAFPIPNSVTREVLDLKVNVALQLTMLKVS